MRLFERIATWFEDWTLPARSEIGSDGTDINPATGLPTIAGAGSPDVAGNPYGSTGSHDYESDWQRHDRWDNGVHDHFQHYDSCLWFGGESERSPDRRRAIRLDTRASCRREILAAAAAAPVTGDMSRISR